MPDLQVQSVIMLSDNPTYTVLTGTTASGIYRTIDGGTDFWELSNGEGCGIGSTSKDIRDFLESSNGDVLCAVYGEGSDGGVFLSADKGKHWVSISDGFGSGNQTLSSIIANSGSPPTYYAGTYTKGSYATTITPLSAPPAFDLGTSSGSSSGGQNVTITRQTGQTSEFLCSCPSNYSCGSCTQAIASFGGIDAATTSCSSTSLTVTAPRHPTGTVDVVVRNPDTRISTLTQAYTFTDGSGTTEMKLTRNGSNQIVATWKTGSPVNIYRSPEPDFTSSVRTDSLAGCVPNPPTVPECTFNYPESDSGTDAHIYFYTLE